MFKCCECRGVGTGGDGWGCSNPFTFSNWEPGPFTLQSVIPLPTF